MTAMGRFRPFSICVLTLSLARPGSAAFAQAAHRYFEQKLMHVPREEFAEERRKERLPTSGSRPDDDAPS